MATNDNKNNQDTIREKKKKQRLRRITKKEFENTLVRVFTKPVSGKPKEDAQEASQTSESHPSDDYNDKRKSQDKTGDKED